MKHKLKAVCSQCFYHLVGVDVLQYTKTFSLSECGIGIYSTGRLVIKSTYNPHHSILTDDCAALFKLAIKESSFEYLRIDS